MDRQFDELSRSVAEPTSRREALWAVGRGIAGLLLAGAGLGHRPADAQPGVRCCAYRCIDYERGKTFRYKYVECHQDGSACLLSFGDGYITYCELVRDRIVRDCSRCS